MTIACVRCVWLLVAIAATAVVCAATEPQADAARSTPEERTANVTRSERMLAYFKDPKINAKRQQIRPRADYAPLLGPQKHLPFAYHRTQSPHAQVLRRVQNNVAPHQQHPSRFAYEAPPKGTYYSAQKHVPHHAGGYSKGNAVPQGPQYDNANAVGGPGGPAQQPEHQQPQYFKASAHFNGQAIVRPLAPEQQKQPVQQYALPPQQPYALQQQQPQVFPNGVAHSGQPAPQQQPAHFHWAYQQESQQLRQPQSQMYSVYEDPESIEHAALQRNSQKQYGSSKPDGADVAAAHRAQDYVKFMNSNEYFLPKRDPNYKQLDAEKDRQQQFHYGRTLTNPGPGGVTPLEGSASFKRPIQVSHLFHHPAPTPNSAIVRGSYHTGNNMFVVNSDGNKAVHHIVASPLPAQLAESTTPATSPHNEDQQRYNAARRRTSEPVRFEFTENDAIPAAAYTNTPQTLMRYNAPHGAAVTTRAPIISSSLGNAAIKSGHAVTKSGSYVLKKATTEATLPRADNLTVDDAEDGDDMHNTGSDNYGRKPPAPVAGVSTSTTPATAEKQDTEEYCERMCAIVHDEDAEIVCGSDGYMYTSEAQMECYASCLHIGVTIQSKGSCNER